MNTKIREIEASQDKGVLHSQADSAEEAPSPASASPSQERQPVGPDWADGLGFFQMSVKFLEYASQGRFAWQQGNLPEQRL